MTPKSVSDYKKKLVLRLLNYQDVSRRVSNLGGISWEEKRPFRVIEFQSLLLFLGASVNNTYAKCR